LDFERPIYIYLYRLLPRTLKVNLIEHREPCHPKSAVSWWAVPGCVAFRANLVTCLCIHIMNIRCLQAYDRTRQGSVGVLVTRDDVLKLLFSNSSRLHAAISVRSEDVGTFSPLAFERRLEGTISERFAATLRIPFSNEQFAITIDVCLMYHELMLHQFRLDPQHGRTYLDMPLPKWPR
jgi:hypothetical protein